MAAMSIYKVLRKTERFGNSFRVCDSKDAGVGSCDQFLTELSLRDCSVYTQRAYGIGLAHFLVGCVLREEIPIMSRVRLLAATSLSSRKARSRVLSAHVVRRSRQPRTINHRLSVLASYSEYAFAAIPRMGGVRGKVASTQPPVLLSPKSCVTV
jgi:hypothetical protein